EISECGSGFRDGDPGTSRGEATRLESTAYRRGEQWSGDTVIEGAVGKEDFGVMGEEATIGLHQLQLSSSQVDRADARHRKLSQVTTDEVPTSVMSAVSV